MNLLYANTSSDTNTISNKDISLSIDHSWTKNLKHTQITPGIKLFNTNKIEAKVHEHNHKLNTILMHKLTLHI